MELNSIDDFKKNFAQIYHTQISPALNTFENDRLKTLKSANSILALFLIIGFVLIGASFLFLGGAQNPPGTIVIFISVGFWAIGVYIFQNKQKNFENKLKARIMPILLKAFGNLKWTLSQVITTDEIENSNIFTHFKHIKVDDNFYGTYRDMPIEITEAEMWYYRENSNGRSEKVTVFKGVLISVGVGKNFKGHTIVRVKTPLYNNKCYEEVKLEDVEFSKQFFVDSNDQIEARFLLTTAFMERFKNISNAFGLKHAECSFKQGKILIALEGQDDLFKLGNLSTPLTDTTPYMKFLKEMLSIYSLIDHLKVTQKTGL